MAKSKGQTLYYFMIFTLLLVISWAMMLNIAKLIMDRMRMQNAADNIALSVAVHKARTMNTVAYLNYLIGNVLAFGTEPSAIQIPSYNTEMIASYINGDLADGIHKSKHNDVKKIKDIVDFLQDAQEGAFKSHALYHKALMAEYLAKNYVLDITPSASSKEKYFGLKRNMKGIKYLKTINAGNRDKFHVVYNPLPLMFGSSMLKNVQSTDPVISFLKKIADTMDEYVPPKLYAEKKYSWYITDKDNFHNQKIKVKLAKADLSLLSGDSKKPLFADLIGISNPSLITVFSAAAIYNTKGTMFPNKESHNTGVPSKVITTPYQALYQKNVAKIGKQFADKTSPYVAALVVAQLEAQAGLHLFRVTVDTNNPIDAYLNSKYGGWMAHLVPYTAEKNDN